MNLEKLPSGSLVFPEVRVVEASAGSGKTFCLARRYIQLLLHTASSRPLAFRHILAITFTNKASVEMKTRILEVLKKIALKSLSPVEEEAILKPLGLKADDVAPLALKAMEELIYHYNFFQVQTIDSFINALLSGCAFKINLSARFKIITDSRRYIEASLDNLIYESRRNATVSSALKEFLRQYLFIENRTGWFPKKELLKLMQTLYERRNNSLERFAGSEHSLEDLFKLKKEILGLMRDLLPLFPANTHKKFRDVAERFLRDERDSFDLDSVSSYFAWEDFPSTKGEAPSAQVQDLWEKINRRLRELTEKEARSLFNSYIRVFDMLEEKLSELASKDDVLFLDELNHKARFLFDEGRITVEELYYRLATRFHHYLMDEFQDTSLLQWQNLTMMVEEALSTGGSLFYVGDKKQAIYGFRGGRVELFDELKGNFGHFNVQEEILGKNYRSLKTIVEFNNAVFSVSNLTHFIRQVEEKKKDAPAFHAQDLQSLENVFHQSAQLIDKLGAQGRVKIETIEAANAPAREELTRQKLLAVMADLRQRFVLEDIAILTRDNAEVEMVTQWLLEAGINVESERTSNIQNDFVIQELIHLLRFLHSPVDNLSFASFILGDIFARASGKSPKEYHQFVFGCRAKLTATQDFYIYKEFRQRYPEVWETFFEDFFKKVGLLPVYEFVISLLQRFACLENFPSHYGFFLHLLELIKTHESENKDLSSFLEYWDDPKPAELFVKIRRHNCVRILTVHKSKGLEFPAVILPFLGMKVQIGQTGSEGGTSYVLETQDDELRLVRLKEKYTEFSEALKESYGREYKKAFFNELNNIYVALTRASKEMYAFIPNKVGQQNNYVSLLIPMDCWDTGQPISEAPRAAAHKDERSLEVSRYTSWIEKLDDESLAATPLDRRQAQEGSLVHFLLSQVGNCSDAPWERMEVQAVARAQAIFPEAQNISLYQAIVKNLLEEPALEDFFFVKDGNVLCEQSLVDASGRSFRLDRLIIKQKDVWVVDFKATKEGWDLKQEQLRQYTTLLKKIYPGRCVRGFIIFWNDASVEEIV